MALSYELIQKAIQFLGTESAKKQLFNTEKSDRADITHFDDLLESIKRILSNPTDSISISVSDQDIVYVTLLQVLVNGSSHKEQQTKTTGSDKDIWSEFSSLVQREFESALAPKNIKADLHENREYQSQVIAVEPSQVEQKIDASSDNLNQIAPDESKNQIAQDESKNWFDQIFQRLNQKDENQVILEKTIGEISSQVNQLQETSLEHSKQLAQSKEWVDDRFAQLKKTVDSFDNKLFMSLAAQESTLKQVSQLNTVLKELFLERVLPYKASNKLKEFFENTDPELSDTYYRLYKDEIEIVSLYRENPDDLRKVKVEVDLTDESIQQHRITYSFYPELERKAGGNYWIFTKGSKVYLVPKQDLPINEHNYLAVQMLFECQDYSPNRSQKIVLDRPAVIEPGATKDQWRLLEKGILSFEPR